MGEGRGAARLVSLWPFLLCSLFHVAADHERDWPPFKFFFRVVGNQSIRFFFKYAKCEKQQSLSLQSMAPLKPFGIPSLWLEDCSESPDAFRFFFKKNDIFLLTQAPIVIWFDGIIIIIYYYYLFNDGLPFVFVVFDGLVLWQLM